MSQQYWHRVLKESEVEECLRRERKGSGVGSRAPSMRKVPTVDSSLHPDTIEFLQILDEMKNLSLGKQQDYGKEDSPFANVIASEDFGIPAWVGCAIRMGDKHRRLQKASLTGPESLKFDSVEDDFMDLGVYAAIGLQQFRKWQREQSPSSENT